MSKTSNKDLPTNEEITDFIGRHKGLMFAMLKRYKINKDLYEDFQQEMALQVVRYLHTYDSSKGAESTFATYLFCTVCSKYLERETTQKRRGLVVDGDPRDMRVTGSPEDALIVYEEALEGDTFKCLDCLTVLPKSEKWARRYDGKYPVACKQPQCKVCRKAETSRWRDKQ